MKVIRHQDEFVEQETAELAIFVEHVELQPREIFILE